ncbi:putative mannose-1-phosphate guanylyltransferase [Helianthus annuus]|nr:putative mannose-1-phosphate guanylyltransferase [Helianthus annuus]
MNIAASIEYAMFFGILISKIAQIGPNVSISTNAHIGAGARLINYIILDDVEIKVHGYMSMIQNLQFSTCRWNCSLILLFGLKCSIGRWSHVQAEGDHKAKLGITILGEAVNVEDEVVVIKCIALPNKALNVSVQQEIIL